MMVTISVLDQLRFNFLKKSQYQIMIDFYCLMTLMMHVHNGECY